jgi:hypothetical protein
MSCEYPFCGNCSHCSRRCVVAQAVSSGRHEEVRKKNSKYRGLAYGKTGKEDR